MKIKKRQIKLLVLALGIAEIGACSSVPKTAQVSSANQISGRKGTRDDSSVEITYVLGHIQHRFMAEAKDGKVTAKTIMDRKVLGEGSVDASRYLKFFDKVSTFSATLHQESTGPHDPSLSINYDTSSQDSCRAPFTVTIRVGKNAKTMAGCRSTDDGHLSRLVLDGEFLLYSKK